MDYNKPIKERIKDFKRRSIEMYGDVIDFSKMEYKNAKNRNCFNPQEIWGV